MEQGFRRFLKRGGRSEAAAARVIAYVREFGGFLKENCGKSLHEADPADLEAFVDSVEQEPQVSAKGHLWGLRYFFEYISNEDMRSLASIQREQRIERRPFPLAGFEGANPTHVERLEWVGIRNVKEMLEAGRTARERAALSAKAGVPEEAILEFVELSDLARIPGVKGVRARLYHDAGLHSVRKLAEWEPEELHELLAGFVERTGSSRIAPLPAEVRFTIAQARRLPQILES